MALDEFLLWVNGQAALQGCQELYRRREGEARRLQDGRQPVEGHRPDPDQHDRQTRPAPSSSTCRSRAAARRPCSSPAAISTPTSTIPTRISASGRPAWCGRSACSARSGCSRGPKVTDDMGWSDIPTCKEAGIAIEQFQMPRTVWLPGGVPADAVAFYADVLKKVSETPEWKDYIERTSQTGRIPDRRRAQALHRRGRGEEPQGLRARRLGSSLTAASAAGGRARPYPSRSALRLDTRRADGGRRHAPEPQPGNWP